MADHDLMNSVQTGQTIWHETHSIAGQNGRAIDVALFNGRVVYASGETGTYVGVEVIDMSDDDEAFSGNTTFLLEDGSVSNQTLEGKATFKDGSGRIGGTGRWKMVNGTGRFANLHGSGSFKWEVVGDSYRAENSA